METFIPLEDGTVFKGRQFAGRRKKVGGHFLVHGTMIGHEEVMTDPANLDRLLIFTYPLVGGYGMNFEDNQSEGPTISALICRKAMENATNFRSEMDLKAYLDYHDVVGVEEADTRGLIRHLRKSGGQRGIITDRLLTPSEMERFFAAENPNTIEAVSAVEVAEIEGGEKTVALWDFGVKDGTMEKLRELGFSVVVYPAMTNFDAILADRPDILFLSSGPGIAAQYVDIIQDIREILGKVPIYATGLGAQFLGMALGGSLQKLEQGHCGASIPVKAADGRVYMTSQNHEYIVDDLPEDVERIYTHVSDQSIEGFYDAERRAYGVLFDPFGLSGARDLEEAEGDRLSTFA